MFSISPCVSNREPPPPPPPPPAILFSLIHFLSIPGAHRSITTNRQSLLPDTALGVYVQLTEWFFPPKCFFFAGGFQHPFPRSAVQHTALSADSYCFVVPRNLTGATLMIAPSLPTSTASRPAPPLSSQLLERRFALQHRQGETRPHTHDDAAAAGAVPPSREVQEGTQTLVPRAPGGGCLQLRQAAAGQ